MTRNQNEAARSAAIAADSEDTTQEALAAIEYVNKQIAKFLTAPKNG